MTGEAWLGLGLAVLGLGLPATVGIMKIFPSKNGKPCIKPGEGQRCQDHEKRLDHQSDILRKVQVSQGKVEAVLPGILEGIKRIENKLE